MLSTFNLNFITSGLSIVVLMTANLPGTIVGYHIAILLALGAGLVMSVIAAAVGPALVLFAWRMAK